MPVPAVLLHEADFYNLTRAYLERCREDNVVHTEIFFDPQTHTARGVAFETVINGIVRACREARTAVGHKYAFDYVFSASFVGRKRI